jgi:UDP-N-acetylglucosamine 4,6-dehydratase
LITGGTGTLGTSIIEQITGSGIPELKHLKRVLVLSRNETEQYKLKIKYGSNIECIIGDVRDYEVTHKAMDGADLVIHAAAIKHIDVAEKNPFEAIKTNIHGTQNVLRAAVNHRVNRLINISTDKTCNPNSTYGATKLIGERLTTASAMESGLNFSTCRFGNILGSNGSVFQLWKSLASNFKNIPLTSLEMTRFFISIENSAKFVLNQINKEGVGVIYVPLLNSFSMKEIASYIAPKSELEIIGLRPGEKVHEDLVNPSEFELASFSTDVIEIPASKYNLKVDARTTLEVDLSPLFPDKWLSSDNFNSLSSNKNRFAGAYSMKTQDMLNFLDSL